MSTPLARHFAEWSSTLSPAGIPHAVCTEARRAILDVLGVMACGAVHPTVFLMRSAVIESPGPCTVAGGCSSNASAAALVNGTAAHVWDFDDTSYTGIMHGSAVVFPAVLAAAEEKGICDSALLTAFVAGSEVAYTLADVVSHEHYFKGWWSTTTLGLVGATAGVARAYELDIDSTAHAIGMAAAGAGAGKCVFGTDSKALFVGDAARRAVEFCKASRAGLTGPVNAFEDERGFLALLNDRRSQRDAAETLGRVWRIQRPGLLFKLNPVCSAAHAAIEATARLVRTSGITASDIARIRCEVPELVKMSLVFDRPERLQEAQFSLPYAVACAVLHAGVTMKDLEVAELACPLKRSIMNRVEYEVAADLSSDRMRSRYPECARVTITRSSGETLEDFCGEAYGMPGRPLNAEHLWRKFATCAAFAGIPEIEFTQARGLLTASGANEISIHSIARSLLRQQTVHGM